MQNEVIKLIGAKADNPPLSEPEKADIPVKEPSLQKKIAERIKEVKAYRDKTCPLLAVEKKENIWEEIPSYKRVRDSFYKNN